MVSVSFRHLFYQPMDEKIKTWTLRFPAKENPSIKKALFDWPIVLQYDVNVEYRLISRKFSGMKFFHPRVRLTNQKPHAFVSVPLLFLFRSRVYISRSYEVEDGYKENIYFIFTRNVSMVIVIEGG